MIQVTGTLKNAIGEILIGSNIRITPTLNDTRVIHASAIVTTDGSGNYDFSLEDGTYALDIKHDEPNGIEEYTDIGEILLLGSTGSTTLEELMVDYAV